MDELVHQLKQLSAQAQVEQRPWVYGHVASYDPATHTVRVIVPSMRDDQTGAPLHSGWLPLGTTGVGSGSGLQVFPVGGATPDKPTAGELAMVAINERGTGVAAVVALFYTNAQQPPNTTLPAGGSGNAGDVLLRHQSGTIQWFQKDGSVIVQCAPNGSVSVSVSGSGSVIVETGTSGSVNIQSPNINISGPGGSDCVVLVTGSIAATQLITGGIGGSDQVTLSTHRHGAGSTGVAAATTVPTPGT